MSVAEFAAVTDRRYNERGELSLRAFLFLGTPVSSWGI
jgi:hypothetical protein